MVRIHLKLINPVKCFIYCYSALLYYAVSIITYWYVCISHCMHCVVTY